MGIEFDKTMVPDYRKEGMKSKQKNFGICAVRSEFGSIFGVD